MEGDIDFDRLSNVQSTLVTQQDRLASTRGEVALNLIAVYKALGGGWQMRLDRICPVLSRDDSSSAAEEDAPPAPAPAGESEASATDQSESETPVPPDPLEAPVPSVTPVPPETE